jgi:hypothetical protein
MGAPSPHRLPETAGGRAALITACGPLTKDITRRTFGILWAETWPSDRMRKSVAVEDTPPASVLTHRESDAKAGRADPPE